MARATATLCDETTASEWRACRRFQRLRGIWKLFEGGGGLFRAILDVWIQSHRPMFPPESKIDQITEGGSTIFRLAETLRARARPLQGTRRGARVLDSIEGG